MKKQLPNQKKLSQFFYSLTFTLLCANAGSAQTILTETFGSQEIPVNFYTGGTSVPAVDYTQSLQVAPGYVSTVFSTSPDACLLFKSIGVSARANMTAPLPTSPTGLVSVLTDNTKLVTWTVNMKSSRLSTNNFSTTTGFPENKYFNATILCASSNKVIGEVGTGNGTDGYAVIVQKSNADAARVSIGLIKFHNGIGVLATDGSVLTRLIESPVLVNPNPLATPALALSATNPNNLSIKVTYNPNLDIWELYYREDPGTAFVDPSTGAYTKAGASVADAFSTPMTHFGFAAGLLTSTSSGNIYQFDNFKIALSEPPAYTAPPVVEKRQAFNTTPTPTVASLVATGTGTLKWYDLATGGTALLPTTSLVNGKIYYGSLTVGVAESDRVATTYVGNTTLKTLPLYESIDYTIGDKLIVMDNAASANAALGTAAGIGLGSWTITPSSNITDDVTILASPSWTNTVLPVAAGNAITFAGSGIDPELKFTDTTSGSLYSSFVFTAADVATIVASTTTDPAYSTPTGFYGFLSESTDPITSIVSTSYASDVMFRKNIATGKFNLGLSKSNSSTDCVWSPTEFDFGTQHLIVISYENIGDAVDTNQVANLWIDPATSTQPAVTLTQNNPISAVDGITPVKITRSNIDRIKLVQASSSSTPTLVIDEIRVADNWSESLGGAFLVPSSPTTSAQTLCNGATVASLAASGTDLKWYGIPTGGTALSPTTVLTTKYYYVSQTIKGLESARTPVLVTIITDVPNAGTDGTLMVCAGTTPSESQLFAAITGENAGGTWTHTGLVYSYTVNATAPCTLSDTASVIVTEQVAPYAGIDGTLSVCAGTVPTELELFSQLGGTPDTGGTWSNAGSVHTYTVIATSPCTTDATATVTVTEQAQPNAGTDGTLRICAGITPTAAQLFSALSGADAGGYWSVPINGVYTYTVNATAPCTGNDTATVTITELAVPTKPLTSAVIYCQNQTAMALSASGITTATTNWYDDSSAVTPLPSEPTPSTVTVGTFNYYVSQTAANGCESDRALLEVIVYPIYNASICYVTSDETETIRNRIYINNNGNYYVDTYQIFREGDAAGVYDLIGELGSNQNSFLDLEVDNSASSYKYKVKTKDISGLVSNDSSTHKTILLQSSLATNNNVNLSWTTYDGIGYGTYTIYRKVNDGVFEFLKSTSASNLSYTDVTANTSLNKYSYYVSIAIAPCSTSSGTKLSNRNAALTSQIRSNYKIISKQGALGIEDNTIDLKIKVYPNPVKNTIAIEGGSINNIANQSYIITDALGKIILKGKLNEGDTTINVECLSKGIYCIKVANNKANKFIKE